MVSPKFFWLENVSVELCYENKHNIIINRIWLILGLTQCTKLVQ